MRRAFTLVLVSALAGCAGPRPAPPIAAALSAPAAWRDGPGAGDAVEADWWRAFGDPVLTAMVETALAGNVDVALAASRVEEARAQFRLAGAQRQPNLTGSAAGGRERSINPAFGVASEQTAGQGQLSVSYDLDLFGRLAQASQAARAAMLATEAARDNVRLAVAAAAAQGYIGLRAQDARLAVLKDTLTARETSLRLARRRAEAGYASQLDLRQAEAEYHATEQLIPAAELAISRQEDGLSLLLGESPRAIQRGLELDVLEPPAVPAGLPAALLRRRPDIVQAEQQLVAADRSLDAVRAAFLPDVRLTAEGGAVVSSLLQNDPIGVYSIGGGLLTPLLDGGRLRAQQGVAAARRDQAAFAYRKAALTAFREVEDALATVTRTAEQEQALVAQRDALASALRQATNRYRAGYSAYLEQIDAQRGLLAAELALVQARADRLSAAVTLRQALGGGWSPSS